MAKGMGDVFMDYQRGTLMLTVQDAASRRLAWRAQASAALEGVTFALPHLVSGRGAVATIARPLDDVERESLQRSASVVRNALGSLRLG